MNFITEETCPDCETVVHAEIDYDKFKSFKTGLIRCPNCGCLIKPCSDCFEFTNSILDCKDCSFSDSEIVEAMTDEDYVRWEKENSPEEYELMKSGGLGEGWKAIVEDIEKDPV